MSDPFPSADPPVVDVRRRPKDTPKDHTSINL